MEDELWNAAERVGADLERSVSWVMRKALEEFIERHRAAKRAAKQAAFDADFEKANSADRKTTVAAKHTKSSK